MYLVRELGLSFIEVLISLFLLSVMLLGMDAMGVFSLQTSQNAYFLSVAVNQLASMEERLRILNDLNDLKNQITLWNVENKLILPNGSGNVSGEFPDYNISLNWDGKNIHELKEHIHL